MRSTDFARVLLFASGFCLCTASHPASAKNADRKWLQAVRDEIPDRVYFEHYGVDRIPVYPAYAQPKKSIHLKAGEVLKIKSENSNNSPQCFLRNENKFSSVLTPKARLDLVSIIGSAKGKIHSDWDFAFPQSRFSMHCEFPKGVIKARVHEEVKKVLAGYFRFHTAKPIYLPLDELLAHDRHVALAY